MTPRFDMRESAQGLERADYDPDRDATHLAIPLRVRGVDADDAVRQAEYVAGKISDLVEGMSDVVWIRSHAEAAYALLANVTTALQQLDAETRAAVVGAAPAARELRRLLTVWVADDENGDVVVLDHIGQTDSFRSATDADLAAIADRVVRRHDQE